MALPGCDFPPIVFKEKSVGALQVPGAQQLVDMTRVFV